MMSHAKLKKNEDEDDCHMEKIVQEQGECFLLALFGVINRLGVSICVRCVA